MGNASLFVDVAAGLAESWARTRLVVSAGKTCPRFIAVADRVRALESKQRNRLLRCMGVASAGRVFDRRTEFGNGDGEGIALP